MSRESEERSVFFAHAVENSYRAIPFVGKTNDLASGAAKLALQRLHPRRWRVKMLLKQPLKNVHKEISSNSFCTTGDSLAGICLPGSCYLSQRVSARVSAAAAKDHTTESIPQTPGLVRVSGSAQAIEELLKFSTLLPSPGFALTSARSLLCRSHGTSMH